MSSRAGRRRRAGRGPHRRRTPRAAARRAPQRTAYDGRRAARIRADAGPRRRRAAPPPRAGAAAAGDPARRGALLLGLRHQEALTMARHRGRGIASINYPIGMNLGGDPSQALVHSQPDRQVHGRAVLDRPRPGHEVGDPPDLRRDARRPGRGRLRRHRRLRHRPALHGQLRLAAARTGSATR